MKQTITIIFTFLTLNVFSQDLRFATSLTPATDFNNALTALSIDFGFYGQSRIHSVQAIVDIESITNHDLIQYDRLDLVPRRRNEKEVFILGLKYAYRVFKVHHVDFRTIAEPWYSPTLKRSSLYAGSRIDFNHKGDMIGIEFVTDPFVSRYLLRFVFTAFKKK